MAHSDNDRVSVWKIHLDAVGRALPKGERSDRGYKWQAGCTCGWNAISWSWSRQQDLLQSGQTLEEWIEEQGSYSENGGAMVMALDHVGLWKEKLEYHRAL